MFDIGFAEMLVIAIVALIVIGPQRLPKAARTLGAFFGRMQRYVADVKADVEREMELEELRKFKTNIEDTAREFQNTAHSEMHKVQENLQNEAETVAKEAQLSTPARVSNASQLDLDLNEAQKQA